jgi:peptidoglycan biosynthesis protein MviN/MurJ (putative lipid II flippase)
MSLFFQGLVILFTRSFYAEGKTGVPLIVNFTSTAILIGSSILLIALFKSDIAFQTWLENLMKVGDVSGAEVLILPIGYSIGMAVNAILHFVAYGRKNCLKLFLATWRSFVESAAASILGAAAAYGVLWKLGANSVQSATLSVFLQGFAAGLTGIVVIMIVFQILGNQEWQETVGAFSSKLFKRTSPIGSEPQEL